MNQDMDSDGNVSKGGEIMIRAMLGYRVQYMS